MPLHPRVKQYLDEWTASGELNLTSLTPNQARELTLSTQINLDRKATEKFDLRKIEDREIESPRGHKIPIRVYVPTNLAKSGNASSHPIVVYFHGGGWVVGNLGTVDLTCREIACKTPCVVVSVDYRLALEHKFPAAVEDCYDIASWIAKKENASYFYADPSRIGVCGDSAGGNLAAAVSLLGKKHSFPKLNLQVLIFPVSKGL